MHARTYIANANEFYRYLLYSLQPIRAQVKQVLDKEVDQYTSNMCTVLVHSMLYFSATATIATTIPVTTLKMQELCAHRTEVCSYPTS